MRYHTPPELKSIPILLPDDMPIGLLWTDVESEHRGWTSDPEDDELIPGGDDE